MSRTRLCLSFLLLTSACSAGGSSSGASSSEPARQAEPAPAAAAPKPTRAVEPLSDKLSRPAAPRVVAIGDLHGDLDATRRALRLAGAIDDKDKWVGGALVVVHTGDSIDRGDQDREVLDLLEKLRPAAKQAGGELILLSGNHELMNAAKDFRYVTPRAFETFVAEGGRGSAFQPGGPYARKLAQRPIMMRVGGNLFVHGGILPKHVAYGLDRMNEQVRAYLLGDRPEPPEGAVGADGLLWTRVYGGEPSQVDCELLSRVLTALAAKRMIIGHTVQRAGVTPACNEKLWRIDVGMSRFYGGPVEVLEIEGDRLTVRREPR